MKKQLLLFAFFTSLCASAQVKIGDNPTDVDSNAVLELESTNKGMLLPRLTATQRDAIANPTNSMLIFNTDEGCINMYSGAETAWKSICGDTASGSASYTANCSSLNVSGTYYTGVQLDPDTNYLSIELNVEEPGTYALLVSTAGMYFSASGVFDTTGQKTVVLNGSGYPLVAGQNFVGFAFGDAVCSTVISVLNGVAEVSSCGTIGVQTGTIYAGQPIVPGTVYMSYTAGPAYTGGNVYGITSTTTNAIKIASPLNGTYTGSGQPVDYIITGNPYLPGTTTLNYSVNGYACSFTVPVLSGTGRASAVNCGGTLAGTYQMGTAMTTSNTKVITLTVATTGTFTIQTNNVNGIYFKGTATAASTGSLNVTLYAYGTPVNVGTYNHTLNVSSSAAAFVSCSFSVTASTPSSVPAFNTISCSSLSTSATYIKSSNSEASDYFGSYHNNGTWFYGECTKVSQNGLTLIASAVGEDGSVAGSNINSTNNNSSSSAGAVYVYTRSSLSANWAFQAKIKPTVLDAEDRFGNAVDISADGNTIVVGAFYEDGSGNGVNPASNNSASRAGAAYVFVRSGSTWSQQAYLKSNAVTKVDDLFGTSVAISGDGNTVAVGAIGDDTGGAGINPPESDTELSAGAVFVYKRSGSTWTYNAFLKPTTNDAYDYFGLSVSLNQDGTTLAAGAVGEDGSNLGVNPLSNNSTSDSGAAYIFTYSGSAWSMQAYIKSTGTGAGDWFGKAIDLDSSGNRLIVGARYEDTSGANVNPAINNSLTDSGAAYIYSRSGTTWTPVTMLKASNPGASDQFGYSVAISGDGNTALVAAHVEGGSVGCVNGADNNSAANSGAVYSFNYVGTTWQPSFKFKMPTAVGVTANDYFGGCVSIDSTGKTIVIASSTEDGSGTGINPTPNENAVDSGCVIVYTKP